MPDAPRKLIPSAHGFPREYVIRSQRERLLSGMAHAVLELGYADTRVQDVLDHAGVSRLTFYGMFANKEDCFFAAYDAAVDRLLESLQVACESGDTWGARVRAGLAATLDVLESDPATARMCIVEVLGAGPAALARHTRTKVRLAELLGALGHPDEHVEALPPVVLEAVIGGIFEIFYTRVAHAETELFPLLDELTDMTVRCLTGPDGPAKYL